MTSIIRHVACRHIVDIMMFLLSSSSYEHNNVMASHHITCNLALSTVSSQVRFLLAGSVVQFEDEDNYDDRLVDTHWLTSHRPALS